MYSPYPAVVWLIWPSDMISLIHVSVYLHSQRLASPKESTVESKVVVNAAENNICSEWFVHNSEDGELRRHDPEYNDKMHKMKKG